MSVLLVAHVVAHEDMQPFQSALPAFEFPCAWWTTEAPSLACADMAGTDVVVSVEVGPHVPRGGEGGAS